MNEFELPSFLVVPDTNALYSKKPEHIVSQKFTALWKELLLISKLQLIVPEAVQQELIFKQMFIAQQARENATKSLSTIFNVTAKQMPGLPSDKKLRTDITKTFTTWASDLGTSSHICCPTSPIPIISFGEAKRRVSSTP